MKISKVFNFCCEIFELFVTLKMNFFHMYEIWSSEKVKEDFYCVSEIQFRISLGAFLLKINLEMFFVEWNIFVNFKNSLKVCEIWVIFDWIVWRF